MKSRIITQIAFGADADCTLNPDLFKIMQYTRDNGVIPNITIADCCSDEAKKAYFQRTDIVDRNTVMITVRKKVI